MVDFSAGHIATELSTPIIEAVQRELGGGWGGVSFHPGVMYRHVMVAPSDIGEAECVPPHDLTGKPVVLPTGSAAPRLIELMEASRSVLARFDGLAADQVWLWGQGAQPRLPSFAEANRGLKGALCTAVDLIRGLGVLTGMEVVEVPGATGWYDTDYEGKRDACLRTLAAGADVFLLHVEATDEAGHAGNLEEKVIALENWDRRILSGLVEGLDEMGEWRLLLLPDHPTPVRLRTHTSDSVPYLLVDRDVDGPGGVYTEPATEGATAVPGHELLGRLLAR
jgi:2,3-bisphosphoglycerate-independent phosphoglycerate mutase